MRIANLAGRLMVVDDTTAIDVEKASDGRFSSDVQATYDRWNEFTSWARQAPLDSLADCALSVEQLGAPAPAPRQVFAIGLNYRGHATETGASLPEQPLTFTKFPSCITGPFSDLTAPRPDSRLDWEVELVVVIGKTADRVDEAAAWSHVAGLTVGQDLTDRALQFSPGPVPQFSLAKSAAGFGPTGPVLVTVDEFEDPDDLALGCSVNGEEVQSGRTSDMVFPVPELIARLSRAVTLLPGDVVFTGTPQGTGIGHNPPRHLQPGDRLDSYIVGIGELHQYIR